VLTQKDLYDFIAKNGVEAYDKMAADLAANINSAKAKYENDQKVKAEQDALLQKKVNQFANLIHEWWTPDDVDPLGYDNMAEAICGVIDGFAGRKAELMKHAKNVETKTEKIPGGTRTITTGEISAEDFDKLADEITKALGYAFNW